MTEGGEMKTDICAPLCNIHLTAALQKRLEFTGKSIRPQVE